MNNVAEGSDAEKRLHGKLFNEDYNSAVRPVNDGQDTVGVNITMNIHQIVDVVSILYSETFCIIYSRDKTHYNLLIVIFTLMMLVTSWFQIHYNQNY